MTKLYSSNKNFRKIKLVGPPHAIYIYIYEFCLPDANMSILVKEGGKESSELVN